MIQFPIAPAEDLVLPGEDLDEFNQLRAGLHAEHAAQTPTELLLVEELVQNAWRIRRFRILEATTLRQPVAEFPTLNFLLRAIAAAERASHRALTALTKLQKARGFVPSKSQPELSVEPQKTSSPQPRPQVVPAKTHSVSGLDPSLAAECGLGPAEFERLRSLRERIHRQAAAAASRNRGPSADSAAA
ncbi:MAG TPA: hypothetical protein VKX25_04390 [Bryobacteraceae bacterium]|jgi:hypothetical protein|nr:hypothetical protein [Bryobacteraceae bacterium]